MIESEATMMALALSLIATIQSHRVKKELIRLLNEALKLEYAARIQYLTHAEQLSGQCAEKLVERMVRQLSSQGRAAGDAG